MQLPDPPTNTAVRTMLRILEQKGHLTHRQDGLKFVYRARRPRARAGRTALERVLRTFFDGSLEKAVAAHLGDEADGAVDRGAGSTGGPDRTGQEEGGMTMLAWDDPRGCRRAWSGSRR